MSPEDMLIILKIAIIASAILSAFVYAHVLVVRSFHVGHIEIVIEKIELSSGTLVLYVKNKGDTVTVLSAVHLLDKAKKSLKKYPNISILLPPGSETIVTVPVPSDLIKCVKFVKVIEENGNSAIAELPEDVEKGY